MAKDLSLLQSKVGRLQGGDEFYMDDEGLFQFYDLEYEGGELAVMLKSQTNLEFHPMVGDSLCSFTAALAPTPAYGYHIFSAPTAMSLASMLLPTAKLGATLVIDGYQMAADANLSVTVNTEDTLTDRYGTVCSNFQLSAVGYIKLVATADNAWQIVEGNHTVQSLA